MSANNQPYALISVSDKKGLVDFISELKSFGYKFISTSGSAALLQQSNLLVTEVSEITNYPEMLDGRVKTLHPRIHGSILYRRDHDGDINHAEQHQLLNVTMVIVNLYPFADVLARGGNFDEAIEHIDIGGPALLRGAAKNFKHVTAISDPNDYDKVLEDLKANNGTISEQLSLYLAHKAFALTSWYDSHISNYLFSKSALTDSPSPFPERLSSPALKSLDLRYGENHHQRAALYQLTERRGIAHAVQIQGGQMSYNNFTDADCALCLISEFDSPTCCIIKHANPCGVAESVSIENAWQRALNCDPKSAYGGVVAFNRHVEEDLARSLTSLFLEIIIAPSFSNEASDILAQKPKLRLLACRPIPNHEPATVIKSISGGYLLQDEDMGALDPEQMEVVSQRQPSEQELADLMFAWRVAKFVKSNAIILARDHATVGIGAGQTSRIDASKIAIMKASYFQGATESVMASDAFIPFEDTVKLVAEMGITAIIQTGGSIRDKEVIARADKEGMAMIFTKMRHFYH